jgi:glycosyltransferase involved in cell wall biosynthesis
LAYLAEARSSHTAKWVNHFSDKGYEVHLLSFEEPRGIFSAVKVHKLNSGIASGLRYFTAAPQVRKIVASVRPALLHAHYASGYGTLGRLSGFHPYLISVWGSDIFEFPATSPLHRSLLRKNLACADTVFSTSRFMAQRAAKYCEKEISITPFGVDCSHFLPDRKRAMSKQFVIGTVKILEDKYGLDYLIKAFALLQKRYSQCELRLVIAGEGPSKSKLQGMAHEYGIANRTEFLGYVPQAKLPGLLNNFSVFAAISVCDESFGVAVLEASACGLPVVVSDAGGLAEIVQHGLTGMVVPRRSSEAAAAAIATFIENDERRQRMGMAGRDLVMMQYDWTKNARRMEEFYASVLAANGAQGSGYPH